MNDEGAAFIRSRSTLIWVALVTATIVSWRLGHHVGSVATGTGRLATLAIIAVAFVKVRLVGLYFMELRDAPSVLRGIFEGYCVAVCGLVIGMYLAG
jgi:hypothetical protein